MNKQQEFKIFRIRKRLALLFLILISTMIFVVGCATQPDKKTKTEFYTLEYDPPEIHPKNSLPFSIKIERFRAAPFFESRRIAFKEGPNKIDSYFYHRWGAQPADLIASFLLRDMKNTGLFKAVLPFDAHSPYTHLIDGYLEEIYEQDNPDSWLAVLSVSITLVSADQADPAKKVLLQKRYRQTEPCKSKTPLSLAEAMSRAMSRMSVTIILDVHKKLSKDKSPAKLH